MVDDESSSRLRQLASDGNGASKPRRTAVGREISCVTIPWVKGRNARVRPDSDDTKVVPLCTRFPAHPYTGDTLSQDPRARVAHPLGADCARTVRACAVKPCGVCWLAGCTRHPAS